MQRGRKSSKRQSPSKRSKSAAGPRLSHRTMRKDSFGRTYGGIIESLDLHRAQDFSVRPKKPIGDANYSTCQYTDTFAVSHGVTSGSTIAAANVQSVPAANTYFSIAPVFHDLLQDTSFAAIFDQYRFDKIEFKFVPQSNAINQVNAASPNNGVPSLWVALDFDDSNVPTSLAQIQEYDNVQCVPYGEGLMVTLLPSITPAAYAVGAFSGYAVQRAGWLDIASDQIPHYGIKGVATALGVASTEQVFWNVYCKYYVSFRNTR